MPMKVVVLSRERLITPSRIFQGPANSMRTVLTRGVSAKKVAQRYSSSSWSHRSSRSRCAESTVRANMGLRLPIPRE